MFKLIECRDNNRRTFEHRVRSYLADGYRLHGPLIVLDGGTVLLQALVKPPAGGGKWEARTRFYRNGNGCQE